MSAYTYETCCVNMSRDDVPDLDAMIEAGRSISYDTFTRHVSTRELAQCFPFYNWDRQGGLHMRNDWAIRYYRSTFRGQTCYYLVHSAIEYIFTKGY